MTPDRNACCSNQFIDINPIISMLNSVHHSRWEQNRLSFIKRFHSSSFLFILFSLWFHFSRQVCKRKNLDRQASWYTDIQLQHCYIHINHWGLNQTRRRVVKIDKKVTLKPSHYFDTHFRPSEKKNMLTKQSIIFCSFYSQNQST